MNFDHERATSRHGSRRIPSTPGQAKNHDPPEKNEVRRGDIWTARFDSNGDSNMSGACLVVVVSNDSANRHSSRIQVLPIGFHNGRAYPCEAVITIKRSRQQKAFADRILTISKSRLIAKIKNIGRRDMADVERAIMLQLGLIPLWASSDVPRSNKYSHV